jgi:hypothetical protein
MELNTVLPPGALFPHISHKQRSISDGLTPSFHRKHVVRLCPMTIRFQFATLSLRPLGLAIMQQLFTGMLEMSHCVVDRYNKTSVSDDN